MPLEITAAFSVAAPSLDVLLACLAILLPGTVALVPSVLGVLLLPAPVRVIYRIHHHRRGLLAVGWTAAVLLLLRGLAGAVSLGGALAVVALAVLFSGFYLALYPGRLFAPVTDPGLVPAPASLDPDAIPGDEEVVGLLLDGEPRAYTLSTLIRSHVVLDRHADQDLAVTYCSLSSTGTAFRTVGRRLRAVTAVDNNVVLYDETSGDLVHQAGGRVVCGPGSGGGVESVPVVLTRWDTWSRLHPRTRVSHRPARTWFDRRLRAWMLRMHRVVALLPKPFHPLSYEPDPRLPPMARVLGVAVNGAARAYPLDAFTAPAVLEDELGGEPLVILAERREGPITSAFSRRLDGRDLRFGALFGEARDRTDEGGQGKGPDRRDAPAEDALARDRQTGSLWNAAGRAVAGPLAGRQLDLLPQHQSAFWFAWAAVHPATELAVQGTAQPVEAVRSPDGAVGATAAGLVGRVAAGCTAAGPAGKSGP